MKAKAGDVIECLSCKKPAGNIGADIPDGSMVLAKYLSMSTTRYGSEGPICDSCNGVAAFHDSQGIGWTIQVHGKRVN
jgi:hypothetical protein